MLNLTHINNLKICNMKNLKFKTSRGGRFNNSGYVTFVGFEDILDGRTFQECWFCENKEIYIDLNGEEADCQINDDGTGYLDIDGDYDTTTVVAESELNPKQINAIVRATGDGWRIITDIVRIIREYYTDYVDDITTE